VYNETQFKKFELENLRTISFNFLITNILKHKIKKKVKQNNKSKLNFKIKFKANKQSINNSYFEEASLHQKAGCTIKIQ